MHGGREAHFFKQCRKEVDAPDQNQIVQRVGVGDNEPHASEPQASQGFSSTLKIFHGVVFIDVVSLQEAVNFIPRFKAK